MRVDWYDELRVRHYLVMNELLEAARDVASLLDAEGARAEADNLPMTDKAVEACHAAGLYGTMVPRDVGGSEYGIADSLDVFSEIARADGSAGWVVMAASTAACYFGAYCPEVFAAKMFEGDRVPIVAGQFAPNGIAIPTEDFSAYQINGKYNFGSGINNAQWVGCGSFTQPPDGVDVDYVFAVVPNDEVVITGNWDVMGLRSTASYDYTIDSLVPVEQTFSFGGFTRHRGGSMYDLGVLCLTEVGHAGWCMGVIRRAIDEAAAVAIECRRMAGTGTVADDPRFQYDLAMAESTLRSAEGWIRAAFGRAEQRVLAGDPADPVAESEARQATTYLHQQGIRALQDLYLHLGTKVLRDSAFQRCYRDLHAGSQHAMVSPRHTFEFAERILGKL